MEILDSPELLDPIVRLINDRDLAARMGRAARDTVAREFSPRRFKEGLTRAITTAQQVWRQRMLDGTSQAFRTIREY